MKTVSRQEPLMETNSEGTISLLDILTTLAKRKTLILLPPLIVGVVTFGATKLFMPNVYTARTSLLPPLQNSSSSAAALSGLNSLGLGGIAATFGVSDPGKLYVGMLTSRTVADRLIERFKLKEYYYGKDSEDTKQEDVRKYLVASSAVSQTKDGIISIEVEDEKPEMAAALANAYVDELYKLNETLAVTEASQRRLFFEKQLVIAREGLSNAEQNLKRTQERTGLIEIDGQAKVIIESIAKLRAQVAAKEVEIQSLGLVATDRNPQYVRAQEELRGLRGQLNRLERNQPGGADIFASKQVPEASLAYIRNLREVKYYERIYELLSQQYEVARVDEARNASLVQVLDKAIPPDKASGPRRSLYVIVVTLLTLGVTMATAFIQEEMTKLDVVQQRKYALLRSYLGFKEPFKKH